MSQRLVVDDKNQLQEWREQNTSQYPAIIEITAKVISYIFHPLFLPVYVTWFLVRLQPYLFAGINEWGKGITIIQSILMYTFFPLVTVLLLKALKFIDSIYLETQKDRIIPLVVCGIWYFWAWYVKYNLPDTPPVLLYFSLAIFIAGSIGLIANIYMKVSMHSIAIGIMCTFFALLAFTQSISFGFYISAAFLIGGLVCTARFIVSDHTQKEIYVGLMIGIISQLIAFKIG
ncbi:MAG: hypothetical protein M3O67_04365 [Bacteroidota bacterium]|nr:hypothetical protein [Bacteroidota bacterium]